MEFSSHVSAFSNFLDDTVHISNFSDIVLKFRK